MNDDERPSINPNVDMCIDYDQSNNLQLKAQRETTKRIGIHPPPKNDTKYKSMLHFIDLFDSCDALIDLIQNHKYVKENILMLTIVPLISFVKLLYLLYSLT